MKKFICIWNPDTFEAQQEVIQLHDITFFTEDKGYSKENIEAISNLEVGEVWICDDYGTSHVVIRVVEETKLYLK